MPGDYRALEKADEEYRIKKAELEKAIEEGKPSSEIEELKEQVKKAKDDANYAHSKAMDI